MTDEADYTGSTTDFWQAFRHPDAQRDGPPYRYAYPAPVRDGRSLALPLRQLPEPGRAVASLIANQASFTVTEGLADVMADDARAAGVDVIVGLPTLGLVFAPLVARRLGHAHYVPLGYSRKFWYDDALSVPVHSVTSPQAHAKRLFIDPNMLPRCRGRRVAVIDDAVSSGTTLAAALRLLARADVAVGAIIVAMVQGTAWAGPLAGAAPVSGAMAAPIFRRGSGGWYPIPGTMPGVDQSPI